MQNAPSWTCQKRQPNRIHWKSYRTDKNKKVCQICHYYITQEECPARKMVQWNKETNIATVYHLGFDKCTSRSNLQRRKDIVQNMKKRKAEIVVSYKEARKKGVDRIASLVGKGQIGEAQEEAEGWTDPSFASRVLTTDKQKQDEMEDLVEDDCNSFDAVAIIKRGVDKLDPNYIYRLSNGSMNNLSDYVFLTLTKMVQLAQKMDLDGETNVLQEENAYFDGTFNRVHGFVSFALWMFHPTLRKVVRLANMELHTENMKDITIFFTPFNDISAKVSGKDG